MNLRLTLTAAIVAATIALPIAANAQIVNGGFETPDIQAFQTFNVGDSGLNGWSITTGNVDLVDAIGNGFTSGPAFEGGQYVDLNGTTAGTMSQSFSTVVGTTYSVAFAYANNYTAAGTANATVRIFDSAGDVISPQTVIHSASLPGNLDWTLFSTTFVARQSTSTLEFASLVSGGNGGVLIDGVSVNPVPEPATILTMTGLLVAMAKRKRR